MAASPDVAVVFPAAAAGAVVVDVAGWVVVPAGLLKSEDAGALVDVVAALAGVLRPLRFENIDGPEVEAVVVPALAAVVEVPDAGVAEAGVAPPSLGKLNPPELPPPAALDPVFADENLLLGASVAAGAGLLPFRLRGFAEVVAGCDEAGCVEAGVVPRLKVGGLLAGVAEGVAPPRFPNKDGFGVACVPCVPDWAAPPKRPGPDGAGDG